MTTLTLARRGLALCFVLALPLSAAAQQQHLQDYRALISKSGVMTPIGPRMFGDEQNLYTGTTQFVVTDVSLPGNDGLPVAVTRRYVAEPQQIANKAFGDWELDLPRITAVVSRQTGWQVTPTQSGHTATDRCRSFGSPVPVTSAGTTYQPNEYWQGYQLIMPGEQPRALVNRASSNTAQPGTVVTSDWWRVNCVTLTAGGPGEGFEAVSPDGTRYLFERLTDRTYSSLTRPGGSLAVFDSSSKSDDDSKERAIDTLDRTEVVLPITRVTDRYGNSVSYHYGPCSPALPTCARLTSISASDNRHLSIGYVNGRISTVSDNTGRTWTYSYRGAGTNVLEGSLIDVNLPDGTDWTIDLQDIGRMSWTYPTQDAQCNLGNPIYVGGQAPPRIGTIGHPSGATATFTFRVIRHGRNGTPANDCQTSGTVAIASYHARVWDQLTLTEKSISNLGDWNFGYTPCSSFCSSRKTVHVTDPRGYVTSYTYGNTWNGDEGLLESIGEGGQSGQTPLRIETFRYFPASSSGNSYPEQIGVSAQDRGDRVRKIYVRPLSSHTICQQRMAFRRSESNLDSYGNPQRIVRSNGSISDFQFNANDCAAVTLTTRKDETLQFNNDASSNWVIGTLKKSTDGLVELEYMLDSESRITQIRRFNKLQTTLTYHSGTPLVHTAKDGLNNTTTLTSYHRGIPRRIDYADGGFITAVVSDRGLITQVTDEEGRATAYEYDSDNSLLKKVTPPGAGSTVTNIAYTQPAGSLGWRMTRTEGTYTQVTQYDRWLRPVSVIESGGPIQRAISSTYDADGRTIFRSYPSASTSSTVGIDYLYDGLGRILEERADSELGALVTGYSYDNDFKLTVTDPKNNSYTSTYYALDRPTTQWPLQTTGPSGRVTTIARDKWGKPTSVNRNGVTRTYTYYSTTQELQTIANPETGTTTLTYDAAGNLDTRFVGGLTTAFNHDPRNRLSLIDYPGTTADVTRTYWKDGQLKTASTLGADGSTWTYAYNPRGALQSETLALSSPTRSYAFQYAYNSRNQLTQLTWPDGGITNYTPNTYGQSTTIGSPTTAFATAIAYNSAGQLTGFDYGNGLARTLTYNTRLLPNGIVDEGVFDYTLTYDKNGNPTTIADGHPLNQGGEGTRTYTYDVYDRLLTATAANLPWSSAAYGYDHQDNLTTRTLNGQATTYVYDSQQRLDELRQGSTTTASFAYDGHGNITSYADKSFIHDAADRLLSLTRMGDEPWLTVTDEYRYDAHGRRTGSRWFPLGQQPVVDEDTVYTGDGLQRYSQGRRKYETCSGDTALRAYSIRYHYLGRQLIASEEKGQCTTLTRYHHTDALGSIIARTDPSGAVTDRNRYEPYGKQTDIVSHSVEPAFTAHNQDQSGLLYMQARYYDPAIGRFLATDPLGIAEANGGAFNRFAYASNNPIRNIDPKGMQDFGVLGNLCASPSACGESGAEPPVEVTGDSLKTVGAIGLVAGATVLGITEIAAIGTAAYYGYAAYSGLSTAAAVEAAATLGAARAIPLAAGIVEALAPGASNNSHAPVPNFPAAAERAKTALMGELHPLGGKAPATVTAGFNTQTGKVAARACADGLCAERHVETAVGAAPGSVFFTPAGRPRNYVEVPICPSCEARYGRDSFPAGTRFRSDEQ